MQHDKGGCYLWLLPWRGRIMRPPKDDIGTMQHGMFVKTTLINDDTKGGRNDILIEQQQQQRGTRRSSSSIVIVNRSSKWEE